MFNKLFTEPITFKSNPPISEKAVIVADQDKLTGNYKPVVKYVPASNKSFFDGVHYSRETMSLRAILNLGVPLQPVSLGVVENDPTVLDRIAAGFESQVFSELDRLESQVTPPVGDAAVDHVN